MNRRYNISYCECPECHHEFPIPRTLNRTREKNHRKRIYCPWCKKIVNMVEHRDNDFIKNGLGEEL